LEQSIEVIIIVISERIYTLYGTDCMLFKSKDLFLWYPQKHDTPSLWKSC